MSKPSRSWVPSASPSSGMEAPFDKPNNKNWNVNAPKMNPNDGNGNLTNRSNAMIVSADNRRIGLWVNNISTDFVLGGSVAQSQDKQQFFPHNFAAPRVSISGQSPNGYEFGRLAEVVRESHQYAISDQLSDAFRAVTFISLGRTYKPVTNGSAGEGSVSRTGHLNRTTKGSPSRIVLDGYISSMTRGSERHIVAFDWQFDFVVLRASNLLGMQDPTLSSVLIKSVKTIEDALSTTPSATPSLNPFSAYDQTLNTSGDWQQTPTSSTGG